MELTVTAHSAVTSPQLAVMVAVPTATAVIVPLVTVATSVSDEDHVMVLSSAFFGEMVAVIVVDSPIVSSTEVWLRVIEVTEVGVTVITHSALTDPA